MSNTNGGISAIDRKIGQNILLLRTRAAIAAETAAKELSLSEQEYLQVEAGAHRLRAAQAQALAILFRSSVAEIYGETS